MKCPKCQTENEIGAKFCNECGAKLEIACPECNKMNRPGSRFCNECGHEMVSTWQIMGTQTHEGDAVFIDQFACSCDGTFSGIVGSCLKVSACFRMVAKYPQKNCNAGSVSLKAIF